MLNKLRLAIVVCLLFGITGMAQEASKYEETIFPKKKGNKKLNSAHADKNSDQYFGTNLITIAPIFISEDGVGLSVCMEKILDDAAIISYQVPLSVAFNTRNRASYFGNSDYKTDVMFYLTPGLKFYPTSAFGKERISVGPSLVIGVGQKTVNDSRYFSSAQNYPDTKNKLMLGAMINACLNEQQTKYLYLGADLGLGVTYFNRVGGENQPLSPIVQLSLKMGFRY